MLAKHQPDDFLLRDGRAFIRDRQQQQFSALHSLAGDLLTQGRMLFEITQQSLQMLIRVRRDVRDPDSVCARPEANPQQQRTGLVFSGFNLLPALVVIAVPGQRVARDRAPIGAIVVFTRQINQVNRQRLTFGAVNAKVVPVCPAIAPVLIAFAFHAATKMRFRYLFNLAKRAAFKVGLNNDWYGGSDKLWR